MIHFPRDAHQPKQRTQARNLKWMRVRENSNRTRTYTQNEMFIRAINEPKRFGWLMAHLIWCLCAAFAIYIYILSSWWIIFLHFFPQFSWVPTSYTWLWLKCGTANRMLWIQPNQAIRYTITHSFQPLCAPFTCKYVLLMRKPAQTSFIRGVFHRNSSVVVVAVLVVVMMSTTTMVVVAVKLVFILVLLFGDM